MEGSWKTQHIIRMWPRALFHMKQGKPILRKALQEPGVYVLYRDDKPYYIGKTGNPLIKRLSGHALKPNWRRYNFWNYFSAFQIADSTHRNEVEAILISAMPAAANSARPKIPRVPLDAGEARLFNKVQAFILTGKEDASGAFKSDEIQQDEDSDS